MDWILDAGFVSTQDLELQPIHPVLSPVQGARCSHLPVGAEVPHSLHYNSNAASIVSVVGNYTLKAEDFWEGLGRWEAGLGRAAGKWCNAANSQQRLWGQDSTLRERITFPEGNRVHAGGWGI